MKSPTATYAVRLASMKRWLGKSSWQPDTPPGFDYEPFVDRAISQFNMRRKRATMLVAKAARLLRGDFVTEAGRPASAMTIATGDEVQITNNGGRVMFEGRATVRSKSHADVATELPDGSDINISIEVSRGD